jgi:hypothetical protein
MKGAFKRERASVQENPNLKENPPGSAERQRDESGSPPRGESADDGGDLRQAEIEDARSRLGEVALHAKRAFLD